VVDNRAGAAPDGHTIGSANIGTLAVNPALVRAMPFNPMLDLAPVSLLFSAVNVLVCPSGRPFRSVADIASAAKARPETISYGTGGVGSPRHLCGILFDRIAGTRTVAVPYRGGGPQMLALVAGSMISASRPWARCCRTWGRAPSAPSASPTRTRARDLPEVPTMI
jgi:tripartite-type tricarboxylate transporter receptor subunit TctC